MMRSAPDLSQPEGQAHDTRAEAHETIWTQAGKESTENLFIPQSKMRIFESGTPRLYLDLGYGLFLICR